MILFWDTETTGFPDYAMPANWAGQPHLVQLAALLCDDDGTDRASLNVVVEPDGYEIPEPSYRVHGITTALGKLWGIPLAAAVWPFICMRARAELVVAHNIKFDAAIIETAISRMPTRNYPVGPDKRFCTCESASPIVNLPPTDRMVAAGINKPKSPRLEEAYRFLFGEELVGAHNALADVTACKRIYFELIHRAQQERRSA